ncbi:MAG TPA: glycerate kinase, partial [Microbacteriaceae bacterium]|nr:glycerate kinase [Microbacteriaceae bacterium]
MSNLRVLLAPDSFKGSLSAPEVARALAEGIANTNAQAECIRHPLADGGEG